MTIVTGYTAARMQEIEDQAIIGGEVTGDDLILERFNGTTFNAGDVRGPIGTPGVSEAQLDDFLLNTTPVGSVTDYIGLVAPAKWAVMTGQTIVNGQVLYPDFWAIIPASMKSGANIVMPDTRGRVSVGYNSADPLFDAINETGGSKDPVLPSHTHTGPSHTHTGPWHDHVGPWHDHSMNHDHPNAVTDSQGLHDHGPDSAGDGFYVRRAGFPLQAGVGSNTVDFQTTTGSAGAHQHNLDVPNYAGNTGGGGNGNTGGGGNGPTGASGTGDTGSAGVASTNKNLQPYITFQKIIKVEN